jgi:hypothetical protein
LPAALAGQAAILLPRLGSLPVWGDEQFTLNVVRAPLAHALQMLREDFHPPLYFLFLKLWVLLPWPLTLIEAIRLASVGFVLLATVTIDRLWLRDLPTRLRGCFLLLWVLSPFWLLYGRMGRSYTAQVLVAAFAVRWAVDWLRRPSTGTALRLGIVTGALLYLHYLPGLSILASFVALGLLRILQGERGRAPSLGLAVVACGVLYLPWAATLGRTIGRRLGAEVPQLVASATLEHAIRIGYTFLSWTFGETLPLAGLAAAAVVTPPILWLLVQGVPVSREWLPVALGALPFAYLLTSTHSILSMTPSRLAFLLPFHLLLLVRGCGRWPRLGSAVVAGLVATSVIGASSYHRHRDFLNKGYLAPYDSIATAASESLTGAGALLVIDASNIDPTPLVAMLSPSVEVLIARDDAARHEIRRRIDDGTLRRVWLIRNTHDVSSGGWSRLTRTDLERSLRLVRRHDYVPYGRADRLAMRAFGWPDRPDHLLELLEFERSGTAALIPAADPATATPT